MKRKNRRNRPARMETTAMIATLEFDLDAPDASGPAVGASKGPPVGESPTMVVEEPLMTRVRVPCGPRLTVGLLPSWEGIPPTFATGVPFSVPGTTTKLLPEPAVPPPPFAEPEPGAPDSPGCADPLAEGGREDDAEGLD